MVGNGADLLLRQHRTIPALRLKHRSDGCGTASALPKDIQYYLRFWPSSCRTSLAVLALRIYAVLPLLFAQERV